MEKSDYSISNNSIMKSESEGKKLDEFETYEIQAAMESINYFNKEHSKENKKRKDAGNVPICTTKERSQSEAVSGTANAERAAKNDD